MNHAGPVLQARDLRKTFAGTRRGQVVHAVDAVSLAIPPGQMTALVGPDGAGKTTLLRLVAGLFRPDSGTLHVLGLDVVAQPQAVQDRISYMPQRFGLYEDLTVQENLDLYADLHGVPQPVRRERFGRMLQMTDLARFTQRPAGKLSGGMKQKLGLACTLVRSPELLLLDEPSAGVDPLSRRDLWIIVQQLVRDEHLNVVVSTAYMDEAQRCDQVYVLRNGSILASGTPRELTALANDRTFRAVPGKGVRTRRLQEELASDRQHVMDAVPSGGAVRFIRQPDASVDALGIDARVEPRPARLEDAFMIMLRQQLAEDEDRARVVVPAVAPAPAAPGTPHSSGPVIVVRDLVRKFGDFTAVASTSFDVRRGEIFGLLGPNGAGKTTTFRMLCGLLPATSGHLEVAGVDLRTARARARARIGYVSQKFALYGSLTVQENLAFFAGAYGLPAGIREQRVARSMEQFGLDPSARSGELPGGYKQRLAMAAALLHEPEILFLDEPTSGIDPLARRAFWQTIGGLADAGVTVIVTTHFMEEAEYCDRVAIQDAGRLLALGTPRQVRGQAGAAHASDMDSAFIAIVEQAREGRARGAQA